MYVGYHRCSFDWPIRYKTLTNFKAKVKVMHISTVNVLYSLTDIK